jgi:hypothetical protein
MKITKNNNLFRMIVDKPITNYFDLSLFPNEIRALKGEKYVLGNSDLPTIINPSGIELEMATFDSRYAKDRRLFRNSIRTIKISLHLLNIIIKDHNFGSIEFKNVLNTMIVGLESLYGNNKLIGFENSALGKVRGLKMWITRSKRFKILFKLYEALNIMRAELPKLKFEITQLMTKVYYLLIGKGISEINKLNWTKIMMNKPYTF